MVSPPANPEDQAVRGQVRGTLLRRGLVGSGVVLLNLVILLGFWQRERRLVALSQARGAFQKDLVYRLWATEQGGVYVPEAKVAPNPYLAHLPRRDVQTGDGQRLTLVNPAYMTRMVHELGEREYGLRAHITSLKPLRPENAPDPWEAEGLRRFERGERQLAEMSLLDGKPHLRFMGAMVTREGCLPCHAQQGYRVGDVRGGISVSVPLSPFGAYVREPSRLGILATLGLTWLGFLAAILLLSRRELSQGLARAADQARLKEQAETYRALLSTTSEAYWELDEETCLRDVNPAACAMLGFTRVELLTRRMADLEVQEPPEGSGRPLEKVWREGSDRFETRHRHRDGRILEVEVRVTYLRELGRLLVFIRDLTDLHREEEARRGLERQIQRTQRLESLGKLAGGVAHDLNNVLSAILGLAEAMKLRNSADPRTLKEADTMVRACLRGRGVVGSLLGFSRMRVDAPEVLDLNALVREEVLLLERTTLARVSLELDLDPDLHAVRGEPGALGNALMNLAINAVDAMPGGGTLQFSTRNLGADRVELRVQDSGEGMPPRVLEKALDPFFTTKEVGKGTGLGLSVVYGTVQAHGGLLEIESAPGRGTLVRILLPAALAEVRDLSPAVTPAPMRPLRLLLVDDDELILASLPPLMEELGHSVETAPGGAEALERLAQGDLPDLVILDLNMPGLGGAEVLLEIRARHPVLPVILATGYADPETLRIAREVPHTQLVGKPFSLEEVRERMISACFQGRSLREQRP